MAKDIGPTDRLLAQLNQTQLAQKDNPVYQVIKQLIQRIKELENLLGIASTTTNTVNLTTVNQFLVGGSGEDGQDGLSIPGQKGDKGDTGATGAAGPLTLGPMGINGLDGEDGMPIPGPQGSTGPQGIQGPLGPITIGPMGLDGEDGYDGMPLPGPPGLSYPWTLLYTQVAAGAVNYDFANLGNYSSILVILKGITLSSTGVAQLQVSIDNGATFLTTSGDYTGVSGLGVETNSTFLPFYVTNATAARSGFCLIEGFNINGVVKSAHANFFATDGIGFRIATNTNPFNAVRVLNSGAGNLSGGTIYVLGKT